MDSDKIIQELNQRFAAPLKEFYKRRIIFWYDEDKEFQDKLDEVALDNAKLVALSGTNNFEVKKLLSVDDTTSNYLVYCPFPYDKPEDNWLLDIALYSEEFRADLISIWMAELGIPSNPKMRQQVKEYRKFFNAKSRRDKIKGQHKVPAVPTQLHMAVMGALGEIVDVTPAAIIKEVLKAGTDINTNYLYRDFVNFNADKVFWSMVKQGTGYNSENPDIFELVTHILLTATTRTMRLDYLTGLDKFISIPHQAFCFDFISDWLNAQDKEGIYKMAEIVEEKHNLPQRFMKIEVNDLLATETFPCLDEIILIKLITEIKDNNINVEVIRDTVEKRRICASYDHFKYYYDGLLQVANMQSFFKEHSMGFHSAQSKQIWKEYTTEYYLMDTYYRLFHKYYTESQKIYNADLSDLFTSVRDSVENLYKNWFLGKLGGNWSAICSEDLAERGHILEVPLQSDFYKSRIQNADSRVFVVISDALRYEVAVSLAELLKRESHADVKLQEVQGIFPTITKFGMAALLPHKKLEVEEYGEGLRVLADGVPTDAGYRDKVLKSEKENSVALKYTDLIGAKRAERSAMVKGMEVVYIYHDTIDKASHIEDSKVFPACDEAIEELKNLTRIICNDFGGTHILFTADHGFLYTYSPLTEDDKISKSSFSSQIVECGRRYAITKKGSNPDYLQKVMFLGGNTEYEGFAPKENVRIKMNGGGLNFVHGGISLQEMVVPVIDYHFLRNQSKEYQKNQGKYDAKPVEVGLLSATHKVSNMIFNLNFYQKEPVGDNRIAAVYQLYFTDSDGQQVSDISKIIADKTSDNGQERIFRCNFNLKSLKYDNKAVYYIVIADEDGLVVSKEEFQIDIACAVDDFNFFG